MLFDSTCRRYLLLLLLLLLSRFSPRIVKFIGSESRKGEVGKGNGDLPFFEGGRNGDLVLNGDRVSV